MVELLKDHGLLVRAETRTQAETAAEEWLAARGVELEDAPRAHRSWWSTKVRDGHAVGFVQEDHPDAEQLYVVNLPLPVLARVG